MNFSEMPVEIWADLLEEQGEDTTELREWIASGLKVGESFLYVEDNFGNGVYRTDSYGDGYGDFTGDSYIFGDGCGVGDEGSGDSEDMY